MSSTTPAPSAPGDMSARVFFALFCCAISFDRLLLGPYATTLFPDALDDIMHILGRGNLVWQHGLTAWNTLEPGGLPSSAALFPSYSLPTLLTTVAPLWVLVHLWTMLILFMFGYGTYRVAHEYFGVDRRSALLAAVFSSAPVLYTNPQILFIFTFPLFFAWTHDLCKDGLPLRTRVALVAGLVCITATSYPILTLPIYPVFHLFFYLTFGREREHLGRNVAAIFLVWTGYVLFYSPVIYTLLSYVPYSQRHQPTALPALATAAWNYLLDLRGQFRANNALIPSLLAAFFACRAPVVRRCLLFALVPLLVGMAFQSDFRIFLADSILTKMDLRIGLTLYGFPLAICLALVLDRLRKDFSSLPWYWWLLTLALAVLLLKSEDRIVRNALLLPEIALAALLLDQGRLRTAARTRLLVAALCGFVALSFMLGRQMSVVAGEVRVAQFTDNHPQLHALAEEGRKTPFRVGSLNLHHSIAMSYGLEPVDGRGPLFNRYFKDNMGLVVAPQFRKPGQEELFRDTWYSLSLYLYGGENHGRYDQSVGAPPLTAADLDFSALQSLNVRYLLAGQPVAGMEEHATLAFVDPGRGLPGPLQATALNRRYELPVYAYRLNDTLERGRIVSRSLSFPDREQALRALAGLSLEARRGTAVFLDAERQGLPELAGAEGGTALLQTYSPDRLVFDCAVRGPSYLVVANNFDPGWQATVDGAPAKILRADNAFQAVFLERAGRYRVELAYRPAWLGASYAAAFIGFGMICSLLLLGRRAAAGGAPAASPLPDQPTGLALPAGCWKAGLAGGGLAAALWAAGFALLQLPRFPYPHEPVHYALVAIPVAGVLVALALCRALRPR